MLLNVEGQEKLCWKPARNKSFKVSEYYFLSSTAHKTHVLLLFHLRGFYLIGLGLGNSHLVIFSQCLYIHFVLVHSFESFTGFFLATSCSFL